MDAAPAITLVALVAALAVTFGDVPLQAVLRYGSYWVGFIALPGAAVAAVVWRRQGPLATFSVAVALGYSLEIVAWIVTASLDVRGLLWLYPPLVIAGCLPLLYRLRQGDPVRAPAEQHADGQAGNGQRWWGWGVAACSLVALLAVVLWYWPVNPWPVQHPANFSIDLPHQLGRAADALHHFPPSNPSVSNVEQQYHWFFYGHLASSAQITGIELPVLLFRLYLVPLLLVFPVQLAVAARHQSGLALAGPLAALLGTVAGELTLFPSRTQWAFGNYAYYVLYSPTYLYGLIFLGGLLVLVAGQLGDHVRTDRTWWVGWMPVALLLATATGAKPTIVPLVVGGLALATSYCLLRRRPALPATVVGLALAGLVGLAAQLFVYGGAGSARVQLTPHLLHWYTTPFRMAAAVAGLPLPNSMNEAPALATQLVGLPLALVPLLAPLAGALVLLRTGRHRIVQSFLVGMALTGFALSSLLWDPAHSEHWFLAMGLPATAVLGGWGTARLVGRSDARLRAAAAVVAVTAALMVLVWGLRGGPVPRIQPTEFLTRHGLFGLAALLAAVAAVAVTRHRLAGVTILVMALFGASLARAPLHLAEPVGAYVTEGRRVLPEVTGRSRPDVTPDLLAALDWIRVNTDPDDIIAVNNHCLVTREVSPGKSGCADSRVFYYSGFSQRRYVIESWAYTDQTLAQALREKRPYTLLASPFMDRTRLNDRAFAAPTAEVLNRLHQEHGVRYLLVDRRPPYAGAPVDQPHRALLRLADVVFSNSDATVYRLRPPPEGWKPQTDGRITSTSRAGSTVPARAVAVVSSRVAQAFSNTKRLLSWSWNRSWVTSRKRGGGKMRRVVAGRKP